MGLFGLTVEIRGVIGDTNEAMWEWEVSFDHLLELMDVLVAIFNSHFNAGYCDQS